MLRLENVCGHREKCVLLNGVFRRRGVCALKSTEVLFDANGRAKIDDIVFLFLQ